MRGEHPTHWGYCAQLCMTSSRHGDASRRCSSDGSPADAAPRLPARPRRPGAHVQLRWLARPLPPPGRGGDRLLRARAGGALPQPLGRGAERVRREAEEPRRRGGPRADSAPSRCAAAPGRHAAGAQADSGPDETSPPSSRTSASRASFAASSRTSRRPHGRVSRRPLTSRRTSNSA